MFWGIGGEGLFVNVLAISIAPGWHWIHVSIIPDAICILDKQCTTLLRGKLPGVKLLLNFFSVPWSTVISLIRF